MQMLSSLALLGSSNATRDAWVATVNRPKHINPSSRRAASFVVEHDYMGMYKVF
jgi:hypothetical protein